MPVSDTCAFPDAAFEAAENVSVPVPLAGNDRLGGDTVTPGGSPLAVTAIVEENPFFGVAVTCTF